MFTRREFLRRSALVSLAPVVPAFAPRLAAAAGADPDGRVLVVVQLDGGNDGLNAVVPYADDAYARARPTLRVSADRVLKLDDRVGLHPAMRAAADLFHDGRLAVVQNVGYPNPTRSHFDAMAVWHAGGPNPADRRGHGWLGRAADALPRPASGAADAVYVGAGDVPPALRGRRGVTASLDRAEELTLRLPVGGGRGGPPAPVDVAGEDDVAAFARRAVFGAYAAAADLADRPGRDPAGGATYPESGLARHLSLVARLIKLGGGTRVYYAVQRGYDTHANQAAAHGDLLSELARAVKAFLDDLRAAGLSDRVLVVAFSEFGRRVAENQSRGTDHGAAGPVFLAGDRVREGLHGIPPDLADLDDGDVRASTDFRRVYATLLGGWLRVPDGATAAGFGRLPLLREQV